MNKTWNITSPRYQNPAWAQAFSLVELSIVLVILGLLVGGILSGQSLIRASELRSITTQHQGYYTAVASFRQKYFYLPGDMPNAVQFWGLAGGPNGDGIACSNTVSTDARTCNGDGDGSIRTVNQGPEQTRFWQHLANAGLIQGGYTGTLDASNGISSGNAPSGKLSTSLWSIFDYQVKTTALGSFFQGEYRNTFSLGGFSSGNTPLTGIMKPEELWNVDTKTDDGKPATGKMVVYVNGNYATCTDAPNNSTLTANYLLTSTALGCVPLFRQQF